MRRAIAIGRANSLSFVLRLRVRDHISDLFAWMHIDAVADQFASGERGPRFDVVFFDLAAQGLFNDQQAWLDSSAFDLSEVGFIDSTRALPAQMKFFDVSSVRQQAEHLFLRFSDELRR